MAENNSALLDKMKAVESAPQQGAPFEAKVRTWLESNQGSNRKRLTALFGSDEEARKYLVMAMDAVAKQPKLRECDFNSFSAALLDCAALKLYPGSAFGEASILPYKGRAQLIVQYQGFAKLMFNAGFVRGIWAEVVREFDDFEFAEGTDRSLKHRRLRGGVKERGERVAVYCCWRTMHGDTDYFLMFADEVESIKRRSPAGNSDFSPWNGDKRGDYGDTDWMWKKTAIKQAAKLLPKSADLIRAIEVDEDSEAPKEGEKLAVNVDAALSVPAAE